MKTSRPLYPLFSILIFLFFLNSCAKEDITKKKYIQSPIEDGVQTGLASWYGADFDGRPTASGVIYDMYGISAAHKTLPLGTVVKAINLQNNKGLEVVINDRGPFVDHRIIDFSYGAAKELDMVEEGVVPIRIEVVGREPSFKRSVKGRASGEGVYVIQVGSFLDASNADRLNTALSWKHKGVYVEEAKMSDVLFYRVRIKVGENHSIVQKKAEILAEEGYSVWITRVQ
ncbi:MAG: septal ring lytic transglycosylase RlpA family protein [Thermodesulfobacteriota bacterium]